MLRTPWQDRTPNRLDDTSGYHVMQNKNGNVVLCGCAATILRLDKLTRRGFSKRFSRTEDRFNK